MVRPAIAALFNQVSMLPSVPKWYSKHCHDPAGRAVEVADPCGERSGRVASSDSRLYIKIWFWPPIRRCLPAGWAESGIVMKETWLDVRAVVALLEKKRSQYGFRNVPNSTASKEEKSLQPHSHVNIASGDFGCAEEDMSAIATWTGNLHGVTPTVCSGCVKRNCTTLLFRSTFCTPICSMSRITWLQSGA